ncbi:hypothetical protein HMPREF0866_00594 [Ruminococcaceae bacterium D16]|nr:hypothetical protein HMPREF0866_00594 [Ruminococcaceae bacterium D16]
MITMSELSDAWKAIIPHNGQSVGRRADENHPLDFFITYDENCNMQMMLISEFLPSIPPSSQQISVRANSRHDGKYALCFSLIDSSLGEQFISLCWDIMHCTVSAHNKTFGVKAAVKRFCMWQKLFAEEKNKKLSDAEVKGLIGELCALKNVILTRYSSQTAVAGWIGPIGADRDFEFSDIWYEAKAVTLSKDSVTISSADQLDINTEGVLLVLRIEKASPNSPGCFTLNSLADEIRNSIQDSEARIIFESRLSSSKYDPADPQADEPYFLHQIEHYRVDDDFPRIRRTNLSTAISNCTYTLSISGLQKWRQEK